MEGGGGGGLGRVCVSRGVCSGVGGFVCGQGCVCLSGGCPGGACIQGCVSGRCVSQHAMGQTPPPLDRILDTRL